MLLRFPVLGVYRSVILIPTLAVYKGKYLAMIPQYIIRVNEWLWPFLIRQVQSYAYFLVVFTLRPWRAVVSILTLYRKRNSIQESAITCKIISEHEIRTHFGDVTNDRLSVLINEAINSIKRVEEKGSHTWLQNTCLDMYVDEKCYRFKSGSGRKHIVVNYENECPVSEFVGFPTMD